MKAWKITAPTTLKLCEEQSESVGEGNVKIRVNKCVVSKPDAQTYRSPKTDYSVSPIGSCVGMVVEAGEGVSLTRGNRVFVRPQHYCGECSACRSANYACCENVEYYGITRDGFARDFAVVSESDCALLPDRVDDDSAEFLDFIAIATQAMTASGVKKGEHLVISGASTLGIILGQVALHYQVVPILIDINDDYLEMGKQLGIYYTINSKKQNPAQKIFHLTGGKMAECVAHISSGEVPLTDSIKCAGKGGKIVVVGRYGGDYNLDCSLIPLIENGLTVLGVGSAGKNTQIAINMLANKAVNVAPLVAGKVLFDDIPSLFAEASESPDHLKTIVEIK